MARTGGDKTRKRILGVSENLFSSKGFDATTVDEIAQKAGVNKALIYYYFKNKDDLILRLFEGIIEEVGEHVDARTGAVAPESLGELTRAVEEEVEFLASRRRMLSVMLAEALRSKKRDHFLFRCAELVILKEHSGELVSSGAKKTLPRYEMVYEFFTGFLPLLGFVALREKWCEHFGGTPEEVTRDFIEAFSRTHLRSQAKRR